VKARLLIKFPVRQHSSEWDNMAAVRQIHGPSILPRNPSSIMPFLLGLESYCAYIASGIGGLTNLREIDCPPNWMDLVLLLFEIIKGNVEKLPHSSLVGK